MTRPLYITRDQLKVTLDIDDADTYADDDIDDAVAGAADVIDGYKNTRYYATTETRVYSPPVECWTGGAINRWYGSRHHSLKVDDLNTLATLSVDLDGDGTFETQWTQGDQFWLEPTNATQDGIPFNRVVLRPQSGVWWPYYPHSVQINASFGWAATPDRVKGAAKILAARFLKRARETPYGILTIVGEAIAAARLGRIDPDVAAQLDNEFGKVPQPFA